MLKKIWRHPVILTGSILFLSALVFLVGYFLRIPYLKETEFGWILTTLIGGVLVLSFGFMWYWKDQVNAKKRLH